MGAGHTFHGKWGGCVRASVLNVTPSSHDGLHLVAEHREHSQAAALDLLHLQLSKSARVVSQKQRVKVYI